MNATIETILSEAKQKKINADILKMYETAAEIIKENTHNRVKDKRGDHYYWKSDPGEMTKRIAEKIGGNTIHNDFIVWTHPAENITFQFNIVQIENLLAEFKSQLSTTKNHVFKPDENDKWKKMTLDAFCGISSSLPKNYYETYKDKDIKDFAQFSFDSLSEIENDPQYMDCLHNLEQAKKAGYKGLIKVYEAEMEFWNKVLAIARKTDYEALKPIKEDMRIERLAEENEAINELRKKATAKDDYMEHYEYDYNRQIWDTFARFGMDPKNDERLYFVLRTAETAKENKHDVVSTYIQTLQDNLEYRKGIFNESYLKKNGMAKSMGHRQRGRMIDDNHGINNDENFLNLVLLNQKDINEYLSKLK